MGLMVAPAEQEDPNMELRICVYISGRKAYLCVICILYESATFAGYGGTQHQCELCLFRGLYDTNVAAYQIIF